MTNAKMTETMGTSKVVYWLRRYALNAGGLVGKLDPTYRN